MFYLKKWKNKTIVWFEASNSYVVFDHFITELIQKLHKNIPLFEIVKECRFLLKVPQRTAVQFVLDLKKLLHQQTKKTEACLSIDDDNPKVLNVYYSKKYYQFHNIGISILFETELLELLIHPKFKHLERERKIKAEFFYQLYFENDMLVFSKGSSVVGSWPKDEKHFLQGKVSMQLLADMYKKPEDEWMGIFHASAIENGKESILLLGDSGNGKSTALALLHASGYKCLADDFVPVDQEKNVFLFPAAISVKKESLQTLAPFYPELKISNEYQADSKIFRYLAPKFLNYQQKFTCKALVFIKYDAKTDFKMSSISRIEAFQQLVPDSWILPQTKNVANFLDWFLEMPSYQLHYSNTTKMIDHIAKLFNDEL